VFVAKKKKTKKINIDKIKYAMEFPILTQFGKKEKRNEKEKKTHSISFRPININYQHTNVCQMLMFHFYE
jgi:hypothetical protein